MAKQSQSRDVPNEERGVRKGVPAMRAWLDRVGKLEPVTSERTSAELIREVRDRVGYEKQPQDVEEAKRWEEIAAWPEEEGGGE